MPVSLIAQPDTVMLARNPVIYRLRSLTAGGLTFSAKGPGATMAAGSTDKFTTGQTMTIAYTEVDGTTESVVFTAAASPTLENQIPDSSFSGTVAQYWTAVRLKVQAHSRIAPFFTVSITGTYTLSVMATLSDTITAVTIADTAGYAVTTIAATADATPVNYQVLLQVYFEHAYLGGNYTQVASLTGSPDSDGYTYFDISSILAAECRASLTEPVIPVWGATDSQRADNLRRYYVRFTEESGEPTTTVDWQYNGIKYCMNGGVSQRVNAQGNYLSAIDATNSILTWMADGKRVGKLDPEYIAWYNYDHAAHYVHILRTWYSRVDNAAHADNLYYASTLAQSFETLLIPVNASILGVDSLTDAYKYTIQVFSDTGVALSPIRTYYVDDQYYESSRYIQYLNSFGCPEVWRCTGEYGTNMKVDRSLASRPLMPGFNQFASDSYQYARTWSNGLTYRTGYLRKGDADVLQELMIAGESYDVSPTGYIPIQITTNSLDITSTFRDLHMYQLTANLRLQMVNYSKQSIEAAADSNVWTEVGGAAWFDTFLIPWGLP